MIETNWNWVGIFIVKESTPSVWSMISFQLPLVLRNFDLVPREIDNGDIGRLL